MYQDVLDDLRAIGTPISASALVPFLWHEDNNLASHAALNLAMLLPKKEIENALRNYVLTEEQRKAKWFEGVWKPEPIGSSLPIITGRIAYLIIQVVEKKGVTFEISDLDPRIITSLVVQERGHLQQKVERQETELQHSRQMVTVAKMASSLAHEIMQPLQIILMKADNCSWEVEHDQIEKTGILKDLKKITDTTQRIAHIVKRLRILSQEHKPKPEWVDINNVIENALFGFSEQLKSRHIHLEKNLTNDLPLIKADKIQLEQVVIILMSNARDA
ncbi:MAG: hypothetical protein DRR19_28350, partial [Candidatus Parabeggiatoa sp. nov. 1]